MGEADEARAIDVLLDDEWLLAGLRRHMLVKRGTGASALRDVADDEEVGLIVRAMRCERARGLRSSPKMGIALVAFGAVALALGRRCASTSMPSATRGGLLNPVYFQPTWLAAGFKVLR